MPIDQAIREVASRSAEKLFRVYVIEIADAISKLLNTGDLVGDTFTHKEEIVDQLLALARRRALTGYMPMTYADSVPGPLVDSVVRGLDKEIVRRGTAPEGA